MSKYVYAEATQDYYPSIQTVVANSYHDAVEKVMEKYCNKYDDLNVDDWESFREDLSASYLIDLSDLEDYEEL